MEFIQVDGTGFSVSDPIHYTNQFMRLTSTILISYIIIKYIIATIKTLNMSAN